MPELRCAYLTMSTPGDFVTDYELAIEPMQALGWQVDQLPWRDRSIDWNRYDAVYICTPWDYLDDPSSFIQVLETIHASRAVLVNDIELVRWSLQKSYLEKLQALGAEIVPSIWRDRFDGAELEQFFARHETDRVVIKPLIGANAVDTYVLTQPVSEQRCREIASAFSERAFFVQPFIESIQTEGEFSLFYLGGEYSHAIQKKPKAGDFRVQEEHGADIVAVTPEIALVDVANRTLQLVEPEPVYARADFVRDSAGRFLLMELELIEPSLYLRTDAGAAARFARAFDAYVRGRRSCGALF